MSLNCLPKFERGAAHHVNLYDVWLISCSMTMLKLACASWPPWLLRTRSALAHVCDLKSLPCPGTVG
jgi:hypothetical protein